MKSITVGFGRIGSPEEKMIVSLHSARHFGLCALCWRTFLHSVYDLTRAPGLGYGIVMELELGASTRSGSEEQCGWAVHQAIEELGCTSPTRSLESLLSNASKSLTRQLKISPNPH